MFASLMLSLMLFESPMPVDIRADQALFENRIEWTSQDVLLENPHGIFVGNNPVNWVDPWGLEKFYINTKRSGGSSGAAGSSVSGWGHSWVTVIDNSGNATSYGFWPEDAAGKESITGKNYNGYLSQQPGYSDEGGYTPDASMGYDISSEQYQRLQNFMNAFSKVDPYWSLNFNCTSFACWSADLAGVDIPDVTLFGWDDPDELADWLNGQKDKPCN